MLGQLCGRLSQFLQALVMPVTALERRDRDLDVDDRFRVQPRHRGGSDVIDACGFSAKGLADSRSLCAEPHRPLGIVRCDENHHSKAFQLERFARLILFPAQHLQRRVVRCGRAPRRFRHLRGELVDVIQGAQFRFGQEIEHDVLVLLIAF